MVYPVRIGVSIDGQTVIGVENVEELKNAGRLSDTERVYGSQIGHRVGVLIDDSWKICTPTQARKMNADVIMSFPQRC